MSGDDQAGIFFYSGRLCDTILGERENALWIKDCLQMIPGRVQAVTDGIWRPSGADKGV